MSAASPNTSDRPLSRVLFWGSYDLGKPRARILLHGLRSTGTDEEAHGPYDFAALAVTFDEDVQRVEFRLEVDEPATGVLRWLEIHTLHDAR
ncbi:MAG: hypothetical protein JRI25_04685 [Deltaproteobacteria bacterium]|nr:hypothetical protein [Deltaproteobacteria bacterium]